LGPNGRLENNLRRGGHRVRDFGPKRHESVSASPPDRTDDALATWLWLRETATAEALTADPSLP